MTFLAIGAAVSPPVPLEHSTVAAIATFGSSRGANAMNQTWLGPHGRSTSAVPVLPPTEMPSSAAAVANGGRLMRPHLTDRIVDRDGRTVDRIQPREMSQVMSSEAAGEVADMMGKVVEEGTGTAAALGGISVGGKTGTAEVDRPCGPNQVWFIAFAPRHDPKVAIAATVECSSGTGGDTAAPIAKQVMQELLR